MENVSKYPEYNQNYAATALISDENVKLFFFLKIFARIAHVKIIDLVIQCFSSCWLEMKHPLPQTIALLPD